MRYSLIFLFSITIFFSLVLVQPNVSAQIYSCPDKNGSIHFTNTPVSEKCEVMNMKRRKSSRYKRGTSYGKSSSRNYDNYIRTAGNRYNVDPLLIKAVIKTESGFNRYAVSKKGAKGLMQLMPATAKELRVRDPFDPRQNIDGGVRYLRKLLNLFNGNLALSLAAYNAGPTRVKRDNRVPRIPETVNYVKKVLRYYKAYKGGRIVEVTAPPVIHISKMTPTNQDPRTEIL